MFTGEKLFPEADKTCEVIPLTDSDSFVESNLSSNSQVSSESMQLDVTDAGNARIEVKPVTNSSTYILFGSNFITWV